MGSRLEHWISKAPHGKGQTLVARTLEVSRTTVSNMYASQSLDFNVLIRVCELYDLKITEFLGITPDQLPEPLKLLPDYSPNRVTLEVINEKVDRILEKLK
jgi:hypothetical protein